MATWHTPSRVLLTLALAALLPVAAEQANAQTLARPAGKIYCWKNKAGKTECGDKIPYEYQTGAVKELNRQGVITERREAGDPDDGKARPAAAEKQRADDTQAAFKRRQDRALLDAFSNVQEIELKRTREAALLESTMESLRTYAKNIDERYAYARTRADQYVKANRPVPASIQADLDHAAKEKAQAQRSLADKNREAVLLNEKYDAMKKRYAELTNASDDNGGKRSSR